MNGEDFRVNKHLIRIVMSLFLINLYIFGFPLKVISFKIIIKSIIGQLDFHPLLFFASVLQLALDFIISIIKCIFLISNFPIKQIATARIDNKMIVLELLNIYLFTFALGFTESQTISAWIFGIGSGCNALSMFKMPPFYNNKVNILHGFIQQSLLASIYISYHRKICTDNQCPCNKNKALKILRLPPQEYGTLDNFLKLKVAFLEMTLFKFMQQSKKEEQSYLKQNNLLGIYLIFQQIYSRGNPFQGIYNLQKYHDCRTCSLQSCFQQYIIRKIADEQMNGKQQNSEEELMKYRQIISQEIYLKSYLEILTQLSIEVNEFWTQITRKEIDNYKAQELGQKILDKYQKFKNIYEAINMQGGESLQVETMAWKLHFDILNFEQESIQNYERVKTCTNKKRVDLKIANELNDCTTDQKVHLVVISGNPNNFQKIINISQSFSRFSGYTEEFLLKNKITVVLPKIIDIQHERLVKKYIKKLVNTDVQKFTINQSWLKKPNGSLIPIVISIIPKIIADQGLQLIGLIQKVKKMQIFEQSIPAQSVFCIMTDINNKVQHISLNCINFLQLPQEFSNQDIFINQLFKDLPDDIQNNQELDLILDITELQNLSNTQASILSNNLFKVRVLYTEQKFKGDNVLKQYLFVIMRLANQFDATSESPNITQSFYFMFNDDQNGRTISGSKLVDEESIYESEQFTMQSMSSTSSGSSNVSSQDAQLSDIKNSFEFSALPQSLKNYRLKLSIAFIILLVTGIVLLAVNIQSKNQFTQDIESLKVEKTMRNSFSSSKLSLLYLYTYSNAQPKYFNQSTFDFPLNTIDLDAFFRNDLKTLISNLHSSLVQFSQKQSLWDSSFVYKVSQEPLIAQKITPYGNLQYVNSTFFKSVTLFVDYSDYISNTQISDQRSNENIFNYNTAEEIKEWVKNKINPLSTVISYVYFCVFNGSQSLLLQMLSIDDSFIFLVQNHGDSLINLILIFTICCCCIIGIITFLLVPYFFQIETAQKFTIEFLYLTDKIQITEFFKKNKDFLKYLNNHSDSNEEKQVNFDKEGQGQDLRQTSKRPLRMTLSSNLSNPYFKTGNTTQELLGINSTNNIQIGDVDKIKDQELNEVQIKTQRQKRIQGQNPISDQANFTTNQQVHTTNNNLLNETAVDHTLNFFEERKGQGELYLKKKIDQNERQAKKNENSNTLKRFQENKQQHTNRFNKKNVQINNDSDSDIEEENKNDSQNNHHTHPHNLSQLAQNNLDQESQMNEVEKHQFQEISKKLKHQTKKSKIVLSTIFFLIAGIIATFYVVTYVLSKQILSDFQEGFQQYDIFYTRLTCLTESIFFMQKSILYNDTMGDDTYNGQQLSYVFNECSNNEQSYRKIKKDGSGMFQSLSRDLEILDSNQFCQFLIDKGVITEVCKTDIKGFLNLGIEQMISAILTHIQQKRISFIAKPRNLRDVDFLNRMFYQKDTYQYVLIYYKYIEWVFYYIQNTAHDRLSEQMSINFNAIIAVFSVYISFIVIISFFTIIKLINKLRLKLLRIRMLLKLMPAMEIFKHKEKLEKLDTKLL
eukprot:403374235